MYVMSYFKTEDESLYLALSEDGLRWRPAVNGQAVLRSEVGARSIRDPHISRSRDGLFHLFSTDGWSSDSLLHAVSDDLLTWREQALIPVMRDVPGVRNCWAPECFYDREEDCFRIIWSSTVSEHSVYDHRIWQTNTRDLVMYSPARLYFDPGYNVIDACVAWHDGEYLMAFKDERGENWHGTDYKAIRVCRSPRAAGPFTEISGLVSPALTEGPTLFRRGDAWTMFFDHFMDNRFGAMSGRDGRTWD